MTDTVLKFHGGKSYLAKPLWDIVDKFHFKPIHIVEAYCGGATFTLEGLMQGRDLSFCINDMNWKLTNFWHVLQDPDKFKQFFRKIEAMPFSSVEWEHSGWERVDRNNMTAIEFDMFAVDCAVDFFVNNRQSLAGRMDTFAGISKSRTRRGMNEQVSAWLTAVEGLPDFHGLLRKILVVLGPALEIIRKHDTAQTMFYFDPPYTKEVRKTFGEYHEHEMSPEDHQALLLAISDLKGGFLLSGKRCPAYDEAAEQHDWQRFDFDVPNNAAGGKDKERTMESVWTNLHVL